MKKTVALFSWIIVFIFLTSCKDVDGNCKMIDVIEAIRTPCNVSFNDIFELKECIPLQTSPTCILSSHASILEITDTDIIIRDGDEVYRFNRDGAFTNTIGVYGHGFSEHGKILSVCCDEVLKTVYILTFDGKIYHYAFNGEYLGKIPIQVANNESIRTIYHTSNENIICLIRADYTQGVKIQLRSYELNGNQKKVFDLYNDNYSVPVSRESFPIGYRYSDGMKIVLDYDNRLYYYSDSTYVDAIWDTGHLQPNRPSVEDMKNKNSLLNDKLQILDIKETTSFYFVIAYYNKKYHAFIYDKCDNKFILSSPNINPKNNNGLKMKDMQNLEIWPIWCKDQIAMSLISPESVKMNKSLYSQFNIYSIKEDGNPIVFIYKERSAKKRTNNK